MFVYFFLPCTYVVRVNAAFESPSNKLKVMQTSFSRHFLFITSDFTKRDIDPAWLQAVEGKEEKKPPHRIISKCYLSLFLVRFLHTSTDLIQA